MIPPVCEQAEYHLFQREKVEVQLPELYHKIGKSGTAVPFGYFIRRKKHGPGALDGSSILLPCIQRGQAWICLMAQKKKTPMPLPSEPLLPAAIGTSSSCLAFIVS